MRGVAFSALLGLTNFREDALASALHLYFLARKYPHVEYSLSCPRLRPIVNNDKINPLDVHETELCQILCAYRIFLPYVGITVSSREEKHFRDGIAKICATKISAGVSTGIGDHEEKYEAYKEEEEMESKASDFDKKESIKALQQEAVSENEECGDEQFDISDRRSFDQMYNDMAGEGLQPVLNDYIYV